MTAENRRGISSPAQEKIENPGERNEAQERHKNVVERFIKILGKEPEYNSLEVQVGCTEHKDEVDLVFSGKGKGEDELTIRLEQQGKHEKNHFESQIWNYTSEPTALQIAKIIAKKGKPPEMIVYTRVDINDWPESPYEHQQISGTIDFAEVEAEVLQAARALAPEYVDMSLEEIGNASK